MDDGYVGPITNSIIDGVIKELKRKRNKEKILKHIIDPLLYDLTSRYYHYFITIIIILVIMVLILISLLTMTVVDKCSKN